MNSKLVKLTQYRQIMGIAVASIILTVIFVPLQSAEAYTSDLTLPNASTSAVPTSAVGSTFLVTITPAPGELIHVGTIQLILDNGTPNVKSAIFASNGHRIDGSPTLARGNLDITIPTPTIQGYGYGYGFGYSAAGATFSSNTYSLVSPGDQFLAGNTVGYANPVGNFVTGLVGDGTKQIVIEGKLNTAVMSVGSHTLDVLVDTGAGGNGIDTIVTPQLSFTTVGNSAVGSLTITSGSNITAEDFVPGVPLGKFKVKFNSVGNGAISGQKGKPADIQTLIGQTIFSSTSTNTATFSIGSATGTTAGDVFEIDTSGLTSIGGVIEITVPYDETLLPSGFSEGNLRLFHWTGTAWEDITTGIDTVNNIITGQTVSLSPVVAGFYGGTTTTTSTTTGGGGGGSSVVVNQTFQPEFFVSNPLKKIQLQESKFTNAAGQTVFGGKVGEQISISANFRNYQQVAQPYAIIIQVVDKDGFTTDLSWITGTADVGGAANTSRSLTLGAAGDYTVKVFVWNGVSAAPTPLSEVTSKTFTVTN